MRHQEYTEVCGGIHIYGKGHTEILSSQLKEDSAIAVMMLLD